MEGAKEFVLGCTVRGSPEPMVTWNVKGHVIREGGSDENDASGGSGEDGTLTEKYAVITDGLLIRNITKADKGSYKCKATQLENGITDFQDLVIQLLVERECPLYNIALLSLMYERKWIWKLNIFFPKVMAGFNLG